MNSKKIVLYYLLIHFLNKFFLDFKFEYIYIYLVFNFINVIKKKNN